MNQADAFEAERPRLRRLASRLLDDHHEAEDIVQTAWLRLAASPSDVLNVPAWLTTVTTRLCLDRLRARIPVPRMALDGAGGHADPASQTERADSVGRALHIVVATLTPNERVAFVLADTFGYDFASIGEILDRSASAARQLASRARKKVAGGEPNGPGSDWQVVDAFMAAARGGDLAQLLALLAPGAQVRADTAAILAGTPAAIDGRDAVAEFFDGSARAALAVLVEGRPGWAWFHQGQARVAFDFTIADGHVASIVFRADPDVLSALTARKNRTTRNPGSSSVSH